MNRRLNFIFPVTVLTIYLLFTACGRHNISEGEVGGEFEDAELISLYDRGNYEEVVVTSPDGKEEARYVLLGKTDSIPEGKPENAVVLRVPLSSFAIDSEVYASALEELGCGGSVKGMFDAQFVTSPGLKPLIENGQISNLGSPSSPAIEKLLELQPESVMVSYYDGMQMTGIDKLGVPVVKMYDLQETSPLGRAEWLRFIGRLAGKAETADSIFDSVKKRYLSLKTEVDSKSFKPKVLTDTPYEGVWYVPGGASYQAALLKDAGGNYFKGSDKSTGSLNLSMEQVLDGGADADIWLIKSFGDAPTLRSLKNENPLFEELKPFKTGEIYFSDTSRSGLFREFPFHPDLLLEDYHKIFAGENTSALRYFKKIEP